MAEAPAGRTMVQVLNDTLHAEMRRDPAVVVMGQDVGIKGGVFKVTDGLRAEFGPMRVLDTPISEIVIAGAAIGAAMMGLRPVAEFQFADYMHPAYDQIVNQAATMRWRSVGAWAVPVVFRAPSGGGVHGGVYHSQSTEALVTPAGCSARRSATTTRWCSSSTRRSTGATASSSTARR
jgi:2-oxoisovalerate dehydrogenase E1 component beta subunit